MQPQLPEQRSASLQASSVPMTPPTNNSNIGISAILCASLAIALGVVFALMGVIGLFLGSAMALLYGLLLGISGIVWAICGIMAIIQKQQPSKAIRNIKLIAISAILLTFFYGFVPLFMPIDFKPLVLFPTFFLAIYAAVLSNRLARK